ncbi:MAG: DUF554 domain-containing protein [Bacteroidetes bacterium]|nr:DUF554 domain-containing protein [Bacteroidota bacterium]
MKHHLPIGTLINMATVIAGSLLGIWLQQFFPEHIQDIIFQAIGLGTLVIGMNMALKVPEGGMIIFIFCLILGGVIGAAIHLKTGLETTVNQLSFGDAQFAEGLTTAFLIFCVGSITIVGAIEEGINGKRELLMIKSTLDGITSIALASVFGWGVFFSIIPMLIFQGGLTLLARQLKSFFNDRRVRLLSSTGGALIIAVGINLLQLGEVAIENLLPALLLAGIVPLRQPATGNPANH